MVAQIPLHSETCNPAWVSGHSPPTIPPWSGTMPLDSPSREFRRYFTSPDSSSKCQLSVRAYGLLTVLVTYHKELHWDKPSQNESGLLKINGSFPQRTWPSQRSQVSTHLCRSHQPYHCVDNHCDFALILWAWLRLQSWLMLQPPHRLRNDLKMRRVGRSTLPNPTTYELSLSIWRSHAGGLESRVFEIIHNLIELLSNRLSCRTSVLSNHFRIRHTVPSRWFLLLCLVSLTIHWRHETLAAIEAHQSNDVISGNSHSQPSP